MNTASSVACSCIRIRSPSRAPPVNGEVGSTASTATRWPAARNAPTSAPVMVDLPTPGAPVSPMIRAWPARGSRSLMTERIRAESSSASESSRPRARASPARARSISLAGDWVTGDWLAGDGDFAADWDSATDPQQQRLALAAAAAQRGRTEAAAAAAQLAVQVQGDPGARRADRVADRDRAAVDVHHVVADTEVAHGLDRDRRERLV